MAQADKEIARNPQVPSPVDASTSRNKSSALSCTQALKVLIHVLGALLIEAPLGHCMFLTILIRSAEISLRGAYIRNYTVVHYEHEAIQISEGENNIGARAPKIETRKWSRCKTKG